MSWCPTKSRRFLETMANNAQQLYFDESGFTGNNLLDQRQPAFVYAGVAVDEYNASQIHAEAISRFRISAQELKGAHLVKYGRGRSAIAWILGTVSQDVHVMVANKEYALAGKFFEYIFEPALAERSSLFYAIGFHKYIATLLHVFSVAEDADARGILRDFADVMTSRNPSQLETVLSYLDHVDLTSPIGKILTFACCHRKRIEDEIRAIRDSGPLASWSLELSMSALHWLLTSWGDDYEMLDVHCDKSKPIEASRDFFDVFVGRQDKIYIRLGNQPTHSVVYNLAGPIKMVNSRDSHGIQIADIVSSSLAYAFANPDEQHSKEWLAIAEGVTANNLVPEPELIDLTKEGAYVNTWVLGELADRSVKGQNLFNDLPDIISEV